MREKKKTAAGRGAHPGRTGKKETAEKRGRESRIPRTEKARQTVAEADFRNGLQETDTGLIIGRNPVAEALKSGRSVEKIFLLKGGEGSLKKIEGAARDRHIPIRYLERKALDRMADGENHQGVAAAVAGFEYCDVDDILDRAAKRGEDPFLILLDGIEDPHNLGAIIRTADAAGAHGVIIAKHRSAGVTAAAEKTAAGAAAYVPVARVTNIVQTTKYLQEQGIWTAAADMDGTPYSRTDLRGPLALVIGGEGRGVSRLEKETCDFCISIPMRGGVNSLNASNAAAVLMYEVLRQREIQ